MPSLTLPDVRREGRADVVGALLDAIDDAMSACVFTDIEVQGEAVNQNITADVMVSLQNARDAAERIR